MLFARGQKPIQRQRIFAHMRVDQQRNFRMEFPERGVGREGHLHDVPNAAHIHEHLVRSLIGEVSAKLANHRSPVLPPYLRLSTQVRGSIQGGEKKMVAAEPTDRKKWKRSVLV